LAKHDYPKSNHEKFKKSRLTTDLPNKSSEDIYEDISRTESNEIIAKSELDKKNFADFVGLKSHKTDEISVPVSNKSSAETTSPNSHVKLISQESKVVKKAVKQIAPKNKFFNFLGELILVLLAAAVFALFGLIFGMTYAEAFPGALFLVAIVWLISKM